MRTIPLEFVLQKSVMFEDGDRSAIRDAAGAFKAMSTLTSLSRTQVLCRGFQLFKHFSVAKDAVYEQDCF